MAHQALDDTDVLTPAHKARGIGVTPAVRVVPAGQAGPGIENQVVQRPEPVIKKLELLDPYDMQSVEQQHRYHNEEHDDQEHHNLEGIPVTIQDLAFHGYFSHRIAVGVLQLNVGWATLLPLLEIHLTETQEHKVYDPSRTDSPRCDPNIEGRSACRASLWFLRASREGSFTRRWAATRGSFAQ